MFDTFNDLLPLWCILLEISLQVYVHLQAYFHPDIFMTASLKGVNSLGMKQQSQEIFITPTRDVDKGNIWKGANPNLPTKKTSLKPNLPIKKAFLTFQYQLALMVYCKLADKLNIYCKSAEKPNSGGMCHLSHSLQHHTPDTDSNIKIYHKNLQISRTFLPYFAPPPKLQVRPMCGVINFDPHNI